jgi:hypothetical protein
VDTLSTEGLPLFLEGGEWSSSGEILDLMQQANMSRSRAEYLDWMRLPGAWGGGPEIVALSNRLRLPIHVYEVCAVPASPPPTSAAAATPASSAVGGGGGGGALGGLRLLPTASTSRFALRLSCRFGSPLFDLPGVGETAAGGIAQGCCEGGSALGVGGGQPMIRRMQEPIRILSADGR